jgi:diacylglycerol O-acyltransferase
MLRGAIANEASQVAQIVKQLPGTVGTLAGAAGAALQRTQLLAGDQATPSNLTLAPRTVLNQSVGAGRAFAAISLPLDRAEGQRPRAWRHHQRHGADAVQHRAAPLLGQHGGVPRKSLVAAVPISLRAKGDTSADNQASMSLISLGTQVADPRKRLAHIKAATSAMKATMGS